MLIKTISKHKSMCNVLVIFKDGWYGSFLYLTSFFSNRIITSVGQIIYLFNYSTIVNYTSTKTRCTNMYTVYPKNPLIYLDIV